MHAMLSFGASEGWQWCDVIVKSQQQRSELFHGMGHCSRCLPEGWEFSAVAACTLMRLDSISRSCQRAMTVIMQHNLVQLRQAYLLGLTSCTMIDAANIVSC